MRSYVRAIVVVLISFLQASFAHAEDRTNYDEPGLSQGRQYLANNFSEVIDPFTGNLSLQHVDLVLPGPAGFDIKVIRAYNANSSVNLSMPFGKGWSINFGRVRRSPNQACATESPGVLVLEMPDGSGQTLHRSTVSGTSVGSDYITTGFWKLQCDAVNWITAFSPDGTKYEMDSIDPACWNVSKITDRFGNWISFTYGAKLYS